MHSSDLRKKRGEGGRHEKGGRRRDARGAAPSDIAFRQAAQEGADGAARPGAAPKPIDGAERAARPGAAPKPIDGAECAARPGAGPQCCR